MPQDTLVAIGEQDPALARRIRQRLGDERWKEIEEASPLGRLPVSLPIALGEALYQEAGAEAARSLIRREFVKTLGQPFLRSLIDGASNIFRASPERVLGWAPHVWSLIYKDAGTLRTEGARPGGITLVLSELPDEVMASPDYLDTIAATTEGYLEGNGLRFSPAALVADAGEATVRITLRWETAD